MEGMSLEVRTPLLAWLLQSEQGHLAHKKTHTPRALLGLCLAPCGSPEGGAVSFERGSPNRARPLSRFCSAIQGHLAHKKTPTPLGPP